MQVTEHIPGVESFSTADGEGVEILYDDALVIEAIIHNFRVQKILVDDRSKVNLLPHRVFKAMKIVDKNMVRDHAPVKGIGGVPVLVEGKIKLLLTLGTTDHPELVCPVSHSQVTSSLQCNPKLTGFV